MKKCVRCGKKANRYVVASILHDSWGAVKQSNQVHMCEQHAEEALGRFEFLMRFKPDTRGRRERMPYV